MSENTRSEQKPSWVDKHASNHVVLNLGIRDGNWRLWKVFVGRCCEFHRLAMAAMSRADRTWPDGRCAHCHAPRPRLQRSSAGPEGADPCLGALPGVDFACCGHGVVDEDGYDHCYVSFTGGPVLYGNAARGALWMLGCDPPSAPGVCRMTLREQVVGAHRAQR